MGAFQEGMSLGSNIWNSGLANQRAQSALELQQAADQRAAEAHGQQMQLGGLQVSAAQRAENLAGQVEGYRKQLAQLDSAQGGNAAPSPAAMGNAANNAMQDADFYTGAGLPTGGATNPATPVPARGMAPATPPTSYFDPDSVMSRNQILGKIAVLQGQDAAPFQKAYEGAHQRKIANRVTSMSDSDLERAAAGANAAGVPILYGGKEGNNYTILTTDDHNVPDGGKFKLNKSQLQQLVLAGEYSKEGYGDVALNTAAAAHKEIGERVDKWNLTQKEMATVNNDARYKDDTNATKLEIAGMRAELAYAKLAYARSGKEMDPKDATRLNEMQANIEAETDEKKRAKLTGDFKREYGVVMGRMGKVVANMDDKAPKAIPEADIDSVVSKLSSDPAFKGVPYEQQRAKAISILQGGNAGALPSWGGGTTAAAATKATSPSSGTSGSHPTIDAPRGLMKKPDPKLAEVETRLRSPYITDTNKLGALLEKNALTEPSQLGLQTPLGMTPNVK